MAVLVSNACNDLLVYDQDIFSYAIMWLFHARMAWVAAASKLAENQF